MSVLSKTRLSGHQPGSDVGVVVGRRIVDIGIERPSIVKSIVPIAPNIGHIASVRVDIDIVHKAAPAPNGVFKIPRLFRNIILMNSPPHDLKLMSQNIHMKEFTV